MKKDLEREYEFRSNTESVYGRTQNKLADEIKVLNADVASSKKLLDDVTTENAELRIGMERIQLSWLSSQSEIDKLKIRNRSILQEKESYELLVRSSHVSLIEAEGKLSALENILKNVAEELSCARQTISDNKVIVLKAEEEVQRSGM